MAGRLHDPHTACMCGAYIVVKSTMCTISHTYIMHARSPYAYLSSGIYTIKDNRITHQAHNHPHLCTHARTNTHTHTRRYAHIAVEHSSGGGAAHTNVCTHRVRLCGLSIKITRVCNMHTHARLTNRRAQRMFNACVCSRGLCKRRAPHAICAFRAHINARSVYYYSSC